MMILRECRLTKTERRVIKGMGKLAGDMGKRNNFYTDDELRIKRMGMRAMIGHAIFMMRLTSYDRRRYESIS